MRASANICLITLSCVFLVAPTCKVRATTVDTASPNNISIDVMKEIEKLRSPDPKTRALGAITLGEAGAKATPAIPHLIRLLGDQSTFDHREFWQKATFFTVAGRSFGAYVAADATGALAKIGKPAVKPLVETLRDTDPFVRAHAARALGLIRDNLPLEPLCEILKDPNDDVRSAAAIALGQIGHPRAAEPLAALLADKDYRPRQDAIDALIKLGKLATKAVLPALQDWRSREAASWILTNTKDLDAVEPLIEQLKHQDANARQGAAVGLGAIGDRTAIEPLIELLKDPDSHVRAEAVHALGRIGGIALKVYKTALRDNAFRVRINAAYALGRTKNTDATEILIDALKDKNSAVRNQALFSLSRLRDRRAVPAIIEMLREKNQFLRANAASVLERFNDHRAVRPLIEALKDKHVDVRARACSSLGRLSDNEAVTALCQALRDEYPQVRVMAAVALRNISDKQAVPALVETLKDPDWEVVLRAAGALGKIKDTRAVEPLISLLTIEMKNPRKIEILRDPYKDSTDDLPWVGGDMSVTLLVVRALGLIRDRRATKALLSALNDTRWQVRREAARALGRIKDPRAIEPLIAASTDSYVGSKAIAALRLITGHIGQGYTPQQWQKWWQTNKDKWADPVTQPAESEPKIQPN